MSLDQAVDVSKFTSADCDRLVGFYLAELRKVQEKHGEFLNQKFTFIKAIQRDHLTTGANHPCIETVDQLEMVVRGMKQNEWASSIDTGVVDLLLKNIMETSQIIQGLLQFYLQLKPTIRVDTPASDNSCELLKYFLSPQSSVLGLAHKFQLHLNDREEDQVGGILNLLPYMAQLGSDLTGAISAHSSVLAREESEQAQKAAAEQARLAQMKPATPQPVLKSDADTQAMAQEIFEASRAKDFGTQLTAADWRKLQLEEKNRNYVYGLGHFPPFAVDN